MKTEKMKKKIRSLKISKLVEQSNPKFLQHKTERLFYKYIILPLK